MHKLRYPSRRVTGASAYSTVKIRLKFKGYSLRNWLKGYQFRPVQRHRCCAHTTPAHDTDCRKHPAPLIGWKDHGYTTDGERFAAPVISPETWRPEFTIRGMPISPDNLAQLRLTRDDLDPIPPEHPASERWVDIRRKAHPDAGE